MYLNICIESNPFQESRMKPPPQQKADQAASVCETKGMKLAHWADLCPQGRGKTSSVPQLGSLEWESQGEAETLWFGRRSSELRSLHGFGEPRGTNSWVSWMCIRQVHELRIWWMDRHSHFSFFSEFHGDSDFT